MPRLHQSVAANVIADDGGYWTYDVCEGLQIDMLDNGRRAVPTPAWFAPTSPNYRIAETRKKVFYPVKKVEGRYEVTIAPCKLKSRILLTGFSRYDASIYSYTEYQVTVNEVDVEVVLDTPEEGTVFRGKPTGTVNSQSACPILLTGHVRLPSDLEDVTDLQLAFTREKIDAADKQLNTNDRGEILSPDSPTLNEYKKRKVDVAQFTGEAAGLALTPVAGEPNHWTFRAVWNQRLSRTLTKKYDPVGSNAELTLANAPHYWRVRAEVSFKQEAVAGGSVDNIYYPPVVNTLEVEGEGKKFRIFIMAYPIGSPNSTPAVSGGTGSFGDYFENNRAANAMVPLTSFAVATGANEQSVTIPITYLSGGPGTPGGPHPALDYPGNEGDVLRASEVGEISKGKFQPTDILSSITSDDANTLLKRMEVFRARIGFDETRNVNDLFDCYFYKLDAKGEFDNSYILGPHLLLTHSGGVRDEVKSPVHLRLLPDGSYETGIVRCMHTCNQTLPVCRLSWLPTPTVPSLKYRRLSAKWGAAARETRFSVWDTSPPQKRLSESIEKISP